MRTNYLCKLKRNNTFECERLHEKNSGWGGGVCAKERKKSGESGKNEVHNCELNLNWLRMSVQMELRRLNFHLLFAINIDASFETTNKKQTPTTWEHKLARLIAIKMVDPMKIETHKFSTKQDCRNWKITRTQTRHTSYCGPVYGWAKKRMVWQTYLSACPELFESRINEAGILCSTSISANWRWLRWRRRLSLELNGFSLIASMRDTWLLICAIDSSTSDVAGDWSSLAVVPDNGESSSFAAFNACSFATVSECSASLSVKPNQIEWTLNVVSCMLSFSI